MKKTVAWLLAACGLAFCAGCLGPNTAGIAAEQGRLVVEERSFAVNVRLLRDSWTRTEEGFLHVQTTIQNTNRRDFRCQYRFSWFDEDGLALKHAPAPWRPLLLHGRATEVLDAVAPLREAADFRLEMRHAD